jgi:hypothetical protein
MKNFKMKHLNMILGFVIAGLYGYEQVFVEADSNRALGLLLLIVLTVMISCYEDIIEKLNGISERLERAERVKRIKKGGLKNEKR